MLSDAATIRPTAFARHVIGGYSETDGKSTRGAEARPQGFASEQENLSLVLELGGNWAPWPLQAGMLRQCHTLVAMQCGLAALSDEGICHRARDCWS